MDSFNELFISTELMRATPLSPFAFFVVQTEAAPSRPLFIRSPPRCSRVTQACYNLNSCRYPLLGKRLRQGLTSHAYQRLRTPALLQLLNSE
jgi:hypothetical protein